MTFAAGSFADDAGAVPSQLSKMYRERYACKPRRGRRAASFADGKIIFYFQRERNDGFDFCVQDLAIGGQNKMIFKLPAYFLIATFRGNGKFLCSCCSDPERQIQRECGSIKSRA